MEFVSTVVVADSVGVAVASSNLNCERREEKMLWLKFRLKIGVCVFLFFSVFFFYSFRDSHRHAR